MRTIRRPPSRSSAATTAALMATQRATCSSSGSVQQRGVRAARRPRTRTWPSRPRPHAHSRGGRVARASVSHSTAAGCQNAPTRFLPSGRLTPVLPPIAASTWAEQRGGHVHVGDAAVVAGGGEAGHVGDHPAADAPPPRRRGPARRGRSAGRGPRPWRATWPPRPRRSGRTVDGHARVEVVEPAGVGERRLGHHDGRSAPPATLGRQPRPARGAPRRRRRTS